MASSLSGKKDRYRGSDRNHAVDTGLLLALIRGQHLDNEAFVRQHLAECAECRRNYASLKQTSGTLDVLGQMAGYQDYPELSSSRMLVKAEEYSVRRLSGAQQRSMQRSIRWVSLPVAIILVILTLAIMIALALRQFGVVTDPRNPLFGVPHVATNSVFSGGIAQHEPSPTRTLNTTSGATVTPSPSSTTQSGPTIEVCSNQPNQKTHTLYICGSGFTPGDKVALRFSIHRFSMQLAPTAKVNKNGTFSVGLRLWGSLCFYASGEIYAEDVTSDTPIQSNKLRGTSFPGCSGSNRVETPELSLTPG
jgi:anti-sigma factor RsiW